MSHSADLPGLAAPAAYRDLVHRVLPQARAQSPWQPEDGPMPALFVSHGIPPFLESAPWLATHFTWAQAMSKPRAIVVVSAHWEGRAARAECPGGRHPPALRLRRLLFPVPVAPLSDA
jgi:4,5-DOPA dioxygenase extradiol